MVEYNEKNCKQILAINKIIGECIGKKAEIEYCVGDKAGTSYSYSPKNVGNYFQYPEQQKQECERWVKEQASVGDLGNILYSVYEGDLGYNANPATDTSVTSTISGLYVDGTPTLGSITKK
jgi:hypothetical protein